MAPAAGVTADEAYKIAKDAYIFCFPLNYYYRTIHFQILDPGNKKAIGAFGKWRHDGLATAIGQGYDHAEQRHALQLGMDRCSQRAWGADPTTRGWRPVLQ